MSARNKHEAKVARREAKAARKVENDSKYWGPKMYMAQGVNGVEAKVFPSRKERRMTEKLNRQYQTKTNNALYRTVHLGRITTNVKIELVEAEADVNA